MAHFGHPTGPFGLPWAKILQDPATAPEDALSREQRKLTKMACTIGPASWSEEGLAELVDAGMTMLRLNFSHGDHATHAETVAKLRRVLASRKHVALEQVAVMLDTKGPEIRTGALEGGGPVTLAKGQSLEITIDAAFAGTAAKIACSYDKLCESVQVGSTILIADGALSVTVNEVQETGVICTVENDAEIGGHKNMNLPGAKIMLPVLTEKDVEDVVQFGIPQNVDYIAASFVRSAEDIRSIRKVLSDNDGGHIQIIAKIENQEGLENFSEILAETDAIMLARGDLGMELTPEKLFVATKWMLDVATRSGKPTIMATQMLESMTGSPRPTRAECIDVAQAVLDGSHGTMLSGETAKGSFPGQAARTMARIAREAERAFIMSGSPLASNVAPALHYRCSTQPELLMVMAAARLAKESSAALLVVLTSPDAEGADQRVRSIAGALAALYLTCVCLVPVKDPRLARGLSGMYRGIFSLLVAHGELPSLPVAVGVAQRAGLVRAGERVAILDGSGPGDVVLRIAVCGEELAERETELVRAFFAQTELSGAVEE